MYRVKWMDLDGEQAPFDLTPPLPYVEYAFRRLIVAGLTWTCDGEGWTSETVYKFGQWGTFYIARDV